MNGMVMNLQAEATDKQLELIEKLRRERDADDAYELATQLDGRMLRTIASQLISVMLASPRRVVATPEPGDPRYDWCPTHKSNNCGPDHMRQLEDGMYRTDDGSIFKVYHTVHGANVQVAKRLTMLAEPYWKTVRGKATEVRAEFVYEGKAPLRTIRAEHRMTLEQAREFGAVYGVCVRCAATLTREESIERSMGPVCAGKI